MKKIETVVTRADDERKSGEIFAQDAAVQTDKMAQFMQLVEGEFKQEFGQAVERIVRARLKNVPYNVLELSKKMLL